MRSVLLATVSVGLGVSGALARNVINEYGGYYQEGVHYSIIQSGGNDIGVLIHKGSVYSQIWKFEAFDDGTGAPGDIDYIRIQPTGTVGYIRLRVVGQAPAHTYGARHVKEVDLLTNADSTTEVYSVYISGDLGAIAAIEADNIGSIYAAGSLLRSLSAAASSETASTALPGFTRGAAGSVSVGAA